MYIHIQVMGVASSRWFDFLALAASALRLAAQNSQL